MRDKCESPLSLYCHTHAWRKRFLTSCKMLIFKYYMLWIKKSAYLLLLFCYGCLALESFKLLLLKVKKISYPVIYTARLIHRMSLYFWKGVKSCLSWFAMKKCFILRKLDIQTCSRDFFLYVSALGLTRRMDPISPSDHWGYNGFLKWM